MIYCLNLLKKTESMSTNFSQGSGFMVKVVWLSAYD
jgi:hypothetical protein